VKLDDHFRSIANAPNRVGQWGMWEEEDGFYYDVLRLPDGGAPRLKVRSLVGLLPICATTIVEPWQRERVPRIIAHFQERIRRNPELLQGIHHEHAHTRGFADRSLMAVGDQEGPPRSLPRVLGGKEDLSPSRLRGPSR